MPISLQISNPVKFNKTQRNGSLTSFSGSYHGWHKIDLEGAVLSLREGSGPPRIEILVSFLHQCRKQRNLIHAKFLQSYLQRHGLVSHKSIGNLVVSLLVDVGCLSDAQTAFDMLVSKNEYAWNSIVSGHAKYGEFEYAFIMYKKMREGSVPTSPHTFVALLKSCAKTQCIQRGREVHADTILERFERELFVGSTLVDMYAKCGELAKAQQVFDDLLSHDVVSWNALMSGYAKHGKGEEALVCLKQMESEGIRPNIVTFICSLKACGIVGDADEGRLLNAEIARKGLLDKHCFIGNALVDMYAKCGLLAMAEEVFDSLLDKGVISWNSLITGYVKHGCCKQALNCFEEMRLDLVTPNSVTFVCILKSCSILGDVEKGREIHAMIERSGLMTDSIVGNALVEMYASCGIFEKAREVFDTLLVQDVVAWTILITKYARYGKYDEGLACFEEMKSKGVSPNSVILICSLNACCTLGAIERAEEIHAEIIRLGFLGNDIAVGNALINMYANCGDLAKAQDVFDKLPCRDVISWTTLITGYTKHEYNEQALNCFEKMQQEGISPDGITFVCTLKACGSAGVIENGIKIHDEIIRKGLLEGDVVVGNALIDMYVNCGMLSKAKEVLNQLPLQDLVSWTTLIAGYVKHGLNIEALDCFEEMLCKRVSPDAVTVVYSLQACGNVGATEKGQDIHAEIVRKGLLKSELVVGNALIDMYAKCGILWKAHEIFDMLPDRDEISWNALIGGYSHLGECENVFRIVKRMVDENKSPNLITLVSVLNVCSHAGLVEEAHMLFDVFSKEHEITPTMEHYNCMIDLLNRAGQIENAIARIKEMPVAPNLVIWHTVMGACRKWGNSELATRAFEQALWTDDNDAATYICMSNIYAGDGILQRDPTS